MHPVGLQPRVDAGRISGMVRAMNDAPTQEAGGSPQGRRRRARLATVVASGAVLALVLAGCASSPSGRSAGNYKRPGPVGAARTQPPPQPAGVPPVVARTGPADPSERDGPPPASESPGAAVLAALPEPEPQVEPIRQGGPNKPYTVMGQSYEPLVDDVPLKQKGMASWYGKKFHGRRTASGEVFNMYGISAAHRTLPIPSYARVTDVATGKAVVVRVNDPGPFHGGRLLDLSYGAAVKLGVHLKGGAEVEIERITFDDIRTGAWRRDGDGDGDDRAVARAEAPPPPAPVLTDLPAAGVPLAVVAPPTPQEAKPVAGTFTPFQRGFWVQIAALSKRDGVEKLQQRIAQELSALQPLLAVFQESALFKLQVGPYATREQALAAADQARGALSVSPLVIERR